MERRGRFAALLGWNGPVEGGGYAAKPDDGARVRDVELHTGDRGGDLAVVLPHHRLRAGVEHQLLEIVEVHDPGVGPEEQAGDTDVRVAKRPRRHLREDVAELRLGLA